MPPVGTIMAFAEKLRPKGFLFQASGIRKGGDFTSLHERIGTPVNCGPWKDLQTHLIAEDRRISWFGDLFVFKWRYIYRDSEFYNWYVKEVPFGITEVKRYLFCLKWCIKGWAVEPRGEAFSYKLFLSTPPPLPRPCLMPYDTVIVLNELLLVCAARAVLLFLFHFRPRGAILQRLHRANLK